MSKLCGVRGIKSSQACLRHGQRTRRGLAICDRLDHSVWPIVWSRACSLEGAAWKERTPHTHTHRLAGLKISSRAYISPRSVQRGTSSFVSQEHPEYSFLRRDRRDFKCLGKETIRAAAESADRTASASAIVPGARQVCPIVSVRALLASNCSSCQACQKLQLVASSEKRFMVFVLCEVPL